MKVGEKHTHNGLLYEIYGIQTRVRVQSRNILEDVDESTSSVDIVSMAQVKYPKRYCHVIAGRIKT